jgi:hypothetical protein
VAMCRFMLILVLVFMRRLTMIVTLTVDVDLGEGCINDSEQYY